MPMYHSEPNRSEPARARVEKTAQELAKEIIELIEADSPFGEYIDPRVILEKCRDVLTTRQEAHEP